MQGLRERTARNIMLVFILKAVSYGLTLLTSLVLARILFPDEYGVVSMAMVFIGLGETLGDFGLSAAIIQKQKENVEKELHTGATLRILFASLLYISLFLLAPFIADFMGEQRLTNVIRVAGLQFFLTSAGFVVTVRLTRELKFNKIVVANLAGGLSKSLFIIVLALLGFSYWSVLAGNLGGSAITVLVLFSLAPWKSKLSFDAKIARELLGFGKFVLAIAIMVWISFSIDKFVIGRLFGSAGLGTYQVAWTWGITVPGVITGVLSTVLFPTYSRIAKDKERLKKGYLTSIRYIALLAFPLCFALMFLAPEFVHLLLAGNTPKWDGAIPLLALLAPYSLFSLIILPAGSIFMSTGNVRINFWQTLVGFAIISILMYPCVFYLGIAGAAFVYLIHSPFMFVWIFWLLKKIIPVTFSELCKTIMLPFAASLPSALAVLFLSMLSLPMTYLTFLLKTFAFCIVWLIAAFAFSQGSVLREILHIYNLLRGSKK